MSRIKNEEGDNSDVPTFNFSLNEINKLSPGGVTNLFSLPITKTSKRKPGMITNFRDIKKQAVSQLLHVFRPKQQFELDQFLIKKKLAVNAIDAIYESKNLEDLKDATLHKKTSSKYTSATKQTKKYNHIHFQTPPTRQRINHYPTSAKSKSSLSRQKLLRSESLSKLNYSRNEQKFNNQQIQKLRKRSGYFK